MTDYPNACQAQDEKFMLVALQQAKLAFAENEVPIGAVLVQNNQVIATAHNATEILNDATAHAEMLVIKEVQKLQKNWRLTHTALYVTVEPCLMCLGALLQVRVSRLIFGCPDQKRFKATGQSDFFSICNKHSVRDSNHLIKIESGIFQDECSLLLKQFFKGKRAPRP